jgi:signal transduction histidine kinase
MQVADDGVGFDPSKAERDGPGMGLFTMRERILLVGGTFTVTSAPRQGTSIRVTIPVIARPLNLSVGRQTQLEKLHAR